MRHALAVVSSAVLLAAGAACPATASDLAVPSARGTAADDAVNHVVAISVDGLNPDALRRLGRDGAPAFHRMVRQGATTLNARTAVELTRTLPNHTGMLTGRPVTRGREHGVTFNRDNGRTVHRAAGEHVSSVFGLVHDRGGSTAFYSAKHTLDFLDRSWNRRHGARDRIGVNHGRDKIDRYVVDNGRDNVTWLLRRLRNHPDELSFLHLAYPDRAGHRHGFMSGRYLRAVRRTDHQLGRILDTIAARARLRRHVTVVLTADHGGLGSGHSDPRDPADFTVPFMVWGRGVARGADLYELNASTRRDPGRTQPGYSGIQPIRNGAVGNLVADLLDAGTVPGSTFNRERDLRVS